MYVCICIWIPQFPKNIPFSLTKIAIIRYYTYITYLYNYIYIFTYLTALPCNTQYLEHGLTVGGIAHRWPRKKTWLALFINVNSPWSLSVEGYGIAIHVFLHTFVILYHFTYPRVN